MARDDRTKRHYIDEAGLPEWGAASDGRRVRLNLDADEETRADRAAWEAEECRHPDTVIVKKPDSLKRDQYYRHCRSCGLRLSSAIPYAEANGQGICQDHEKVEQRVDRYVEWRKQKLEMILRRIADRQQPQRRSEYDDYLRSPQWRALRGRIMRRAEGLCEGCLEAEATEVHHLSREHQFQEFAFQLVALCEACHHRIEGLE